MELPSIGILLPIRNEAKHIVEVLHGILAQDYPHSCLEVLVIDGMSEDGTRQLVANFCANYRGPFGVRLIDNPKRIVPAAMNEGIRAASAEVIVRVDGHTVVASDYVRRCVEALIATGADNVGGTIESVGTSVMSRGIANVMSSRFGVGGSDFRVLDPSAPPREVDTVPFGTFRRELFGRVGLFNEHLPVQEDYEMNYRIRKSGGRIFDPKH